MAKPPVRQILAQMDVQNERAAVDIYARAAIGAIGLLAAVIFLTVVDSPDRFFAAAAFLIFPVGPAIIGIGIDYGDARNNLIHQNTGERAVA